VSGALVRALAEPAAGNGRWRDLGVRSASAAVLLPVALGCLWAGGWAWSLLLGAAFVLMANEWRTMAQAWPAGRRGLVGAVWLIPGVAAMLWLRFTPPESFGNVLFVLCVVWASDIGAYMVGRIVGGPKLAPAISPGKTRSGAVGGVLAVIVVGLLAAWIGGGRYGASAASAVLLGIVAQAGDLFESGMKRHFGVKDSGNTIPGHGGLLDRLDAVLFAAPVAAIVAIWRGVELWR